MFWLKITYWKWTPGVLGSLQRRAPAQKIVELAQLTLWQQCWCCIKLQLDVWVRQFYVWCSSLPADTHLWNRQKRFLRNISPKKAESDTLNRNRIDRYYTDVNYQYVRIDYIPWVPRYDKRSAKSRYKVLSSKYRLPVSAWESIVFSIGGTCGRDSCDVPTALILGALKSGYPLTVPETETGRTNWESRISYIYSERPR